MWKQLWYICIVLILLLGVGCGNHDEALESSREDAYNQGQDGAIENAEGQLSVGVANASEEDFFIQLRIIRLEEYVKEMPNIDLAIDHASFDLEKEMDNIERYIEEDKDAVVLVPVEYEGSSQGVILLNEANIPVITLGIETEEGSSCFIGSSNIDAGRMQAEFIVDTLPTNGRILYMEGDSDYYHSRERKEGFLEVLQAKRSDIQVLDSQEGRYMREDAMAITKEWIEDYEQVDAIVAANDVMALGIIDVLKEYNRLDGIAILGIDGSSQEALDAVTNEEMTMTVFQDAKEQAYQCAMVLELLKDGQPLPRNIIVPFKQITKDNVEDYREDSY